MKRLIVAVTCAFVFAGCGPKAPPFSSEGQAMLKKFEQYIDKAKVPVFEQMCKEVEKLHDEKRLKDEEYTALHRVCGEASRGQWDRAKANLQPLLEAQKQKK